ncbi:MAG: hypothetical protein IKW84_09655 [Bacteroidaceae bacterium]|nr:hypothetical protein [Bacteroidaceae bacterium]
MDDNNEIVELKEFFQLTLNVQDSHVPVAELIEYLKNTDRLFRGINQTLNEKYAVGYNTIELDVVPFEEGSFKIPIWVKKVVNNPYVVGVVVTLIGNYVTSLLNNEQKTHEIEANNDIVQVENKKLLENKTTAGALSTIASLVIHNDSIRDISVTYEKKNGERENLSISKTVLSKVAEYRLEEETESLIQTNLTMEIVSPVFSDEPSNWKVRINDKSYTARMTDANFLETMNVEGIAFGKGDTIVADFETVVTDVATGGKPKYNITKVISYPEYTKISMSPEKQSELFHDDE